MVGGFAVDLFFHIIFMVLLCSFFYFSDALHENEHVV